MQQKSIMEQIKAQQIVQVMSLGALASPKLIEMAGHWSELTGVWIDQEHSAISHERLEVLLIACRSAGLDAFARVAPTDYATIMRPYEAGCSGVMAAQIRTMQQVEQIVTWAHYPPLGERGLFAGNAECQYGEISPRDQVRQAQRERWLCIQIETPEAVEIVDAIAAHPEVDWLFVGPGDLACTLGVPGDVLHAKCKAALAAVSAACQSHDKPWGVLSRAPAHAQYCRELGCQLFSLYGDVDLVRRGAEATSECFRSALQAKS